MDAVHVMITVLTNPAQCSFCACASTRPTQPIVRHTGQVTCGPYAGDEGVHAVGGCSLADLG